MDKIDGFFVSVKIENKEKPRLNKLSKKHGVKRTQLMRMAMKIGADAIETYDSVYLTDLEDIRARTHEAVKKQIAPALFELEMRQKK